MRARIKKIIALSLTVLLILPLGSFTAKASQEVDETIEEKNEQKGEPTISQEQEEEFNTEEVIENDEGFDENEDKVLEGSTIQNEEDDTKTTEEEQGDGLKTRAANLDVSNTDELKQALESAVDGDVITIQPGFISSTLILEMPNVNVTIEGSKQVWDGGTLSVRGSGVGTLTIQNLILDGTVNANQLFNNSSTGGKLILESLEVRNAQKSVMGISNGNQAETVINNSHFHHNTSVNTASAIYVGNQAKLTINNSTFEYNKGTGGGYEVGAIASKGYTSILTINNSVFKENINASINTSVSGGGGGAMSMHYFKGFLSINQSYFVGNESAGRDGSVASTYDGGAIYIFDGRDGATVDINQSTFESNLAYDDGGAIMIQGTGNPGLTTNIQNSTFINNQAHGVSGGNKSGGAIQFFKNGGSSKMTNQLTSNTFVNNTAGYTGTVLAQQGGAVGRSGAGIFATAAVTSANNLFIGNQVYGSDGTINTSSNYKDISGTTTVQIGTTNVLNADKGDASIHTKDSVLGINNVGASSNLSGITAGIEKLIVPTVPIKPGGIADKTYSGAASIPEVDQRGYVKNKDQGAVSMAWLAYNSNGGTFDLPDLSSYVGNEYYEGAKPTTYYSITGNLGSGAVLSNELQIIPPVGKVFVGWSTSATAQEPDPAYELGTVVPYTSTVTLYAVYKTSTEVTINFIDEDNTVLLPPESKTGLSGDAYELEIPTVFEHTLKEVKDADGNVLPVVDGKVVINYKDNNQTINVIYSKDVFSSNLLVKFVDEEGNELQSSYQITQDEGSNYSIEIVDIEGYTFKEAIDKNENLVAVNSKTIDYEFTREDEEITLIYEKDLVSSTLTIKYVDMSGKPIKKDTVITKLEKEKYLVSIEELKGFVFSKAVDQSGNIIDILENGIEILFTQENQEITLVYSNEEIEQATVSVHFQDMHGNTIKDSISQVLGIDEKFSVKIPSIEGYFYGGMMQSEQSEFIVRDGILETTGTNNSQEVTLIYLADTVRPGEPPKVVDPKEDKKDETPKTGVARDLMPLIVLDISAILLMLGVIAIVKKKHSKSK